MKLRAPQVTLLGILAALTVATYFGIAYLLRQNLPQIRLAAELRRTPSATPVTPTPVPSRTPTPTATVTPTPTPTPAVPQTRYDLQIADRPDDAALRVARGNVYLELGAYVWALADFEAALKLDPTLAEAHLGRGQALYHLKRWQAAGAALERAEIQGPELAAAHAWRGYLLIQQRNPAGAVSALERAVAASPSDPLWRAWLADALWRDGRPDEAVIVADAALALDERCIPAYVARATALAEMGKLADAQLTLDQALTVAPYAPPVFDAQARLYTFYRRDHLAAAEDLARRALAGAQDDLERAAYLDTLGWTLYRLGRGQEALAALDQAIALATVEGQVVFTEIPQHRTQVAAAQ